MRFVRSWPRQVPAGRGHVVDDVERLVIDQHKYGSTLVDLDDDVLLIEWDIAVGAEELQAFADRARQTPEALLVAPYRLYETTFRSIPLKRVEWAHRYDTNRHIATGDPFCHWFGLGLAYLPRGVIAGYWEAAQAGGWPFEDTGLSTWHWRTTQTPVPVAWECRPVHLHYTIPKEL